jgi:hypothetical protein
LPIDRLGNARVPPEDNPAQARADKIDLLFVIDDSGSMRDKQHILAQAVPDLVERLTNPLCVDPTTLEPAREQPESALSPCPGGSLREFNAVQDIHIGVVSTSLGGVGAASCGLGSRPPQAIGHLVAPSGRAADAPEFLVWAPSQRATREQARRDAAQLQASLRELVQLGEGGCPYEMPLEAMYRFLIEPEPYAAVELAECGTGSAPQACAVQRDVDRELLRQRRAFLRYDSLVAIMMLTDENDCSLSAGGQSFHVFDQVGMLARPTAVCASDPDDRCCRSCADPAPAGCPDDPNCALGPFTRMEDSGLLRCFDQKRRLGRDYLYPVGRYIDGLKGARVPARDGVLVANPLFVDPENKLPPRDPSLVFFAAVIGVPWQDLAVDPSDSLQLELKSSAQLEADGTWQLILGDPQRAVLPLDPLMIETTQERSGIQPIIGVPVAPSSAASPRANPINGHETALGMAPMEPQYSCIFELPVPEESASDCTRFTGSNRAICQADDGSYGPTQYRGKSYPGVRELQVIEGVGANAIPASICVRNLTDDTRDDYGYRPVLRQILDRLRVGLN